MDSQTAITVLICALHGAAWLATIDALFTPRSAEGTIAWVLFLILFPYIGLPAYLILGRRRFRGYRKLSHRMRKLHAETAKEHRAETAEYAARLPEERLQFFKTLETIAEASFLSGNSLELLSSGREFFDSLIGDIEQAAEHICLCFYIVRADTIGQRMKEVLLAARKRGVSVWFLYDEFGSLTLSASYLSELREAGVEVRDFNTRQGRWNFFQINFRNHRKIAVVDHRIAYVGGFNIGDEYLGESKQFGSWRDSQVKVAGPAVQEIEAVFLADWLWATQKHPRLDLPLQRPAGAVSVLTVPTGPTDDRERCVFFFQELMASAKERLWISTPYFIPDDALYQTIKLAALRGVDVRIMIPEKAETIILEWAGLFYLPDLLRDGAKILRYKAGYLHAKMVLVDDVIATVGSVNIDNRSLRLAFEITLAGTDADFTKAVEKSFIEDFQQCAPVKPFTLEDLPIPRRIAVNIARLFSPLL